MAQLVITNTLTPNTVIASSGLNTNFSDIATWLNNRYNATDTWLNMKISATAGNPVDITSSASTTELSINNTAADGDPQLSFKLSSSTIAVIGVDDSDSDLLKFGTSGVTAGVSMQIPAAGSQVQFALGSASAPGISLIGEANTGFYRVSAQNVGLSINGTLCFKWNGGRMEALDGAVGSPAYTYMSDNDSGFYWLSSGAIAYASNGVRTFRFSSANFMPEGAGAIDSGDVSNYWNEINYKTLTDRGCLGWFDDGVELQDGRIVSDCEAISAIKQHPTKKTVYGVPMLDYSTFPKVSYKKAAKDGVLLERDKDDEPIGGSDGVEMTSMQSIMIGAIKELSSRVGVLEKK